MPEPKPQPILLSRATFLWKFLMLIGVIAGGLIVWLGAWALPAQTAFPGHRAYFPFMAKEFPHIIGDDFFIGCAMAHCTPNMSDNAHMELPVGDVARIWGPDHAASGSTYGVGCTSNTKIVACAYSAALTVYDGAGNIQWQKDLGPATWTSAPIVTPFNTVVAASAGKLVHYDRMGKEMWADTSFQGFAISPVILQPQAVLVVATGGGELIAFDLWTGKRLAGPIAIMHREGPDTYPCRTWNTPGVRIGHNRFYVSTDCSVAGSNASFLMAYDLDLNSQTGFVKAWEFPFAGYSGASPTVINDRIYFDGSPLDDVDIPYAFGVRDLGSSGNELWRHEMNGPIQTSFPHDPRGGLWVFTWRWANDNFALHPEVRRLDEFTGNVIQSFRVDELVADVPENPPPATPGSIMTIADGPNGPVMLIGAMVPLNEDEPLCEVADGWILAVDLTSNLALWKVRTPIHDIFTGTREFFPTQYTILNHPLDGRKVVVTAGNCTGALGISHPFTQSNP